MGTYTVMDLPSEEDAYRAYRFLKSLEEKISHFRENSEVSRINANAGVEAVEVSDIVLEVIKLSLEISEKTYGYFDISVGSVSINYRMKGVLSEEEARKLVNFRDILVEGDFVFLRKRGMAIDLGGIGKGFAVEKAYEYLGTERGFIGIAGDMKVWGEERVLGVKDPLSGTTLLQMINAEDLCLSTSGNYVKDHISQRDKTLLQITVVHKNCAFADAYATALLSMPPSLRERFIKENPEVGVLELYRDGTLRMNRAFREFFKLILIK